MTNGDTSVHAAYLDVSAHLFRGLFSRTHLLYAVVRRGWPVVVHLGRGAGGSASAFLGGIAENGCLVGRGASRGHGMSPEKVLTSTREKMRARCRATRQTAAYEVGGVVYPLFRGRCRAGNLLQGSNGPISTFHHQLVPLRGRTAGVFVHRALIPLNPGHKLGRGWSGVSSGR